MENLKVAIPSIVNKYLWGIVGVGVIVTLFSYFHTPTRFWVNLVINNFYFTGMALSGLFFLSLQNLTKSSWMRPYQRIPEAMMGYLPVAFVFVLLGLFGSHTLYEWTHAELVKNDEILIKKVAYLNMPFFVTRILIYFAIWIIPKPSSRSIHGKCICKSSITCLVNLHFITTIHYNMIFGGG